MIRQQLHGVSFFSRMPAAPKLYLNMVERFLYECITVLTHKSCPAAQAKVSFFFTSHKNIYEKRLSVGDWGRTFVGFLIDRYVPLCAAESVFFS